MVWHANPHLASFPCGGLSARVPGLKEADVASYSRGACAGYVFDHAIALKRGGADAPSNKQW
jgi:hypothetical protein